MKISLLGPENQPTPTSFQFKIVDLFHEQLIYLFEIPYKFDFLIPLFYIHWECTNFWSTKT